MKKKQVKNTTKEHKERLNPETFNPEDITSMEEEPRIVDAIANPVNEECLPEEDEMNEEEIPGANETNQIAELNDKYIRLYSEFDNYRRRTLMEKIELGKTASAGIITELLPVLDDFDRALKAMTETKTGDSALNDGMVLIYNKFLNILTQKGLQQMKTIGEPFDTDFHEAITTIPAPSPSMKGKVMDEVEKGYELNGKVIRFAKVVVGS